MDFKLEFFPLLEELMTKKDSNVRKHQIKINDMYLMLRYISFYDPLIIDLVNEYNKNYVNLSQKVDGEFMYNTLKGIIPKLPKKYIKYISKSKITCVKDVNEFVEIYSKKHKISEREVFDLLYLYNEIEKI